MNAHLDGLFDGSALIHPGIEIDGATPEGGWKVERAEIRERLSAPYVVVLELRTLDRDFDTSALLGKRCVLTLSRLGGDRRVVGIVLGVEHLEAEEWEPAVRLQLGPALAALGYGQKSRIFQNQSLPAVIESVLAEGLGPYGRSAELDVRGSHPAREMIVQYRESDLQFVQRLCEEAGITYCFDHLGDIEQLLLFDHAGGYSEALDDGGPVPLLLRHAAVGGDPPNGLFRLRREDRLGPTHFAHRGYDWTRPALTIAASADADSLDGGRREVYAHDRGAPAVGYSGDAYTSHGGGAAAMVAADAERCRALRCRGSSSIVQLRPGSTFEVVDHPRPELNGRYAVVEIHHAVAGHSGASEQTTYHNELVCIPAAQRHVPSPDTPRPRIAGCQTATVMAPEGQPIHTDVHGRIKVRFHWDRHGHDERASCWIRVAQGWAGDGLGLTFVPRAGMEVVVTFEDGDPDRPIVTGCVRNGTHRTHHALPANATRSVWRSESVGADGFNELFFEDRGGAELVSLHAQRDLTEKVLHDHTTRVDHDQTNDVSHDQTVHVGHDRKKTVDGKEQNTIGRSRNTRVTTTETLLVGGARAQTITLADALNVGGVRSEQIGGAHTQLVIGSHTRRILRSQNLRVRASQTERIGGSQTVRIGGAQTLHIKGSQSESVGGSAHLTVAGRYDLVQGKKGAGFSLNASGGSASLTAKQNLQLVATEKSITLKAGKSAIELRHDGTILLRGEVIQLVGNKRVVATTKGAKAKLTLDGNKLQALASKCEVKGKSVISLKASKITSN